MDHVACRGCDLLQRVPPLAPGARAVCGRCGYLLAMRARDPLDRPLAIALTAAIALIVANSCELMRLSAAGRTTSTTLAGGALAMWELGNPITAVVVAACAVAAPALYVGLLIAVLIAVRRPPAPAWAGALLRLAERVRPWSMSEVLLLGILVALTKIAQLASVSAGPALYAVLALVLLLPWLATSFDAREAWRRVRWADRREGPA